MTTCVGVQTAFAAGGAPLVGLILLAVMAAVLAGFLWGLDHGRMMERAAHLFDRESRS